MKKFPHVRPTIRAFYNKPNPKMNNKEIDELIHGLEVTNTKEKVLSALHKLKRLQDAMNNLNVSKLRELLQIPAGVYFPSEVVPRVERLLERSRAEKSEISHLQETVFALQRRESDLRAQFQFRADQLKSENTKLSRELRQSKILADTFKHLNEEKDTVIAELRSAAQNTVSTGTPEVTRHVTLPSTFAEAIGSTIRYYDFPSEICVGHATWFGEAGRAYTPAEAALHAAEFNTAAGWKDSCVTDQNHTIEIAVTAHE